MDRGVLGILKFALSKEIEGMDFYRSKRETVKNEVLKEVLLQLSEMENGHVNYIRKLISAVEGDETVSAPEEMPENGNVFRKIEEKEMIGKEIGDLASDLSVVRMGFLIEDDFMNFYRNSADKVREPEMKKVLNVLSAWEKEHRDELHRLYTEMSKAYWNEMGFTPLF